MPRTHLGRDRRSNGVTAGRGPAGEAPPSSGSSIPPARRHRPRDRKFSCTFSGVLLIWYGERRLHGKARRDRGRHGTESLELVLTGVFTFLLL